MHYYELIQTIDTQPDQIKLKPKLYTLFCAYTKSRLNHPVNLTLKQKTPLIKLKSGVCVPIEPKEQ